MAAILRAARALLEQRGAQGLTVRALSRELGVSAPSLYFHVESRDDLIQQLIAVGLQELGARLTAASAVPGPARERAGRLADAYLTFAGANPQLFSLVFGPPAAEAADPMPGRAASTPVVSFAEELVGPDRALFFAESLWSLVHGYAVLSIAQQFRENPDPRAGFEYALDLLLAGARVAGRAAPA